MPGSNSSRLDHKTVAPSPFFPLFSIPHGAVFTQTVGQDASKPSTKICTSVRQTELHPSPLDRFPSSHCSRPSIIVLLHVDAGNVPVWPALFLGAGTPETKSCALLLVSSPTSSAVEEPARSRRLIMASPGA